MLFMSFLLPTLWAQHKTRPRRRPRRIKILNKTPHVIPEVQGKIKLDARLDDPLWKDALVMELEYEILPGENIKPPVKTIVYLAYNKTHLFVGFRAWDPNPEKIRARVTDRDSFDGDDLVQITLDTFNSYRRTYNFACNPHGVQKDFIFNQQGGGAQWDGIWGSNGRITDDGFIVEMSIPLTNLRFQRTNEDQIWSFDARRIYPRNVVHYLGLFPVDRNNICYMCQAERMKGFKGVKRGKNIELNPTFSAMLTQERENYLEGDFVEADKSTDPGLTVKWGFTPNMTLNATVNPDFSHVEADSAQLDINTQFAIDYPEKRPFFQDGASYFASRFRVLNTRSLAEPEWGAKLAGKEGKNSIGFFSVMDNITNLIFSGPYGSQSTSTSLDSLGTALRYRRDIGKSSTLGVVISDREGTDYYNRVAGIDGDLKFNTTDSFMFQFLTAQTRYPDQVAADFNQPNDRFNGSALDVSYSHNARNIDYSVQYQQISPTFRADLGYMPQAGFRHANGRVSYTWFKNPGHWYSWISTGVTYYHEIDFNDDLIVKGLSLFMDYSGPLQTALNIRGNFGKRSYMGRVFDNNQYFLTLGLHPSKTFSFFLETALGDQIDFVNGQAGTRLRLNPVVRFSPGKNITLMLDHMYEKLNVDAGHLYTANISNLRLVYQINRRTFIRGILQYINHKYNPENYSIPIYPQLKHLFTQFLFSYKINPRTVLFLGYSDDHYGFQFIPLTQTNRTFFLKIGYALAL